jgi:hypothetical protein
MVELYGRSLILSYIGFENAKIRNSVYFIRLYKMEKKYIAVIVIATLTFITFGIICLAIVSNNNHDYQQQPLLNL